MLEVELFQIILRVSDDANALTDVLQQFINNCKS